jgi:hypothetical protein
MHHMVIAFLVACLLGVAGTVTVAASEAEGPLPELVMHEGRFMHTATLLDDGSVLIAGGSVMDIEASAERYDPATRRCEHIGPLDHARSMHTATRLEDGRVVLIGGFSPDRPHASIEVFDPAAQTFDAAGHLQEPRSGHTAVLLDDGRILVAGGAARNGKLLASVELYDPASGRSESVRPLRTARAWHTATRLADGHILIAGGADRRAKGLRSVELYDPQKGRFKPIAKLDEGRIWHAATLLEDGRVLIVGGSSGRKGGALTIEVFDPSRDTFSAVGKLELERMNHTSTLLADGRVLLVGGSSKSVSETVDPTSGQIMLAAPPGVARGGHRATRLDDGTILVSGGWVADKTAASTKPITSAELYGPLADEIVASGPIEEELRLLLEPSPMPTLEPLGGSADSGRVKMPASGFAITIPEGWSVEVAAPERDIGTAEPGAAWEALRAFGPKRRKTCSVYIAVAPEGQRSLAGFSSISTRAGATEVRWAGTRRQPTLEVPDPDDRIESDSGASHSSLGGQDRYAKDDPRVDHDVAYAVVCGGDRGRRFDAITESLRLLPAP